MAELSDPKFNLSLSGKTAFICGASAGIGAASAQVLAHLGAKIIAVARTEEKLRAVVESLPGKGHRWISIDLNDHAALKELAHDEVARFGSDSHSGIDILINNSAGPKGGPILDAKPEDFAATFNQHVLSAQILAQAFVPGMRAQKFGRIINVISTSVRVPVPNLGVSNTIRGAMASWAKTLSLEVAADGITVNSVLPGYTTTDRLSSLLGAAAQKSGKPEVDVAEEWKTTIPARRFGKPEEIAAAVAFFASPAAAYITGTVLPIDGGRTPSI